MSFTNDVKCELCGYNIPDKKRELIRCGMYLGFHGSEPYFTTTDKAVAGYVRRIFPRNKMKVTEVSGKGKVTGYFVAPVNKYGDLDYFFDIENYARQMTEGNDEDIGLFLRGAFITCGNVYVQKAGYHLELSPGNDEKCDIILRVIQEHGMEINRSTRGRSTFLYSKNSEHISDFLTFIGAVQGAMHIMNIKIMKGVRSNINRSVNCETANIDRTIRASSKQVDDIRLIYDSIGENKLDDELRALARLRLSNPEMSLSDLGKQLDPPITRSGVNHRFERIARIADGIRSK